MAAALMEVLVDAARAHASAGRGERTAIVADLAARLGVSQQTAYTRLRSVTVATPRKRRQDAGVHTLSQAEAERISALVEETRRATGTGQLPLERAIEMLRDSGQILAGRVDPETGEVFRLSVSSISRAMRHHFVHPSQLAETSPATRLSSPHPNWCWQIDASVSRQFYLAADGAQTMPLTEFYRGKPQNFERIADRRLWRYAITDHASGYIEVFYVQGAESSANLLAALIHTMVQRSAGCMHGVPRYLMADPGSAVTAAPTKNFCRALGIELIVNKAENARAKGQVERANYQIEQHFEAPLKLVKPFADLGSVNALAARWARAYNATAIHTRTGMTRRDAWLRITADQLVIAPSVEVLRALPLSEPKTCTVRDWQVKFGGARYDLSGLRGTLNGQRVDVVRNPFDADTVRVLVVGEDGRSTHFLAPLVRRDGFGFDATAAQIGTDYRAAAETPVEAARKSIERLAMDVATDDEAKAARKAKRLAFGGTIDPMAHMRDDQVVPHLPRSGRASKVQAPDLVAAEPVVPRIQPVYEPQRLTQFETAQQLRERVQERGGHWSPEMYARMAERWPEGAFEADLDAGALWLLTPALRAVGAA